MYLDLAQVRAAAKDRPEGYLEAVLASGRVIGDRLEITSAAWASLRRQYGTESIAPDGDVVDALDAEIRRVTGQVPCKGCGG